MYVKRLKIAKGWGDVIRDIMFHRGLNLIVDNTPEENSKETGNNVGKTTVLKLIDFCLGGNDKRIYTEQENLNKYTLVKEFLDKNKVLITLWLTADMDDPQSPTIRIERNFLSRRRKIQRFNGMDCTDDEFDKCLSGLLSPDIFGKKPTFRQIIAHNVRYSDLALTNTLKVLDRNTRDDEYETLYLFLFGCNYDKGKLKQELRIRIDSEEKFKNSLEKQQSKSAYVAALEMVNTEIDELEKSRSLVQISPSFKSDIDELNDVKFKLNQKVSELTSCKLRLNIVSEAKDKLSFSRSEIDVTQLRQIYDQATSILSPFHKTFEELLNFHNAMIEAKIHFLEKDLPKLQVRLEWLNEEIRVLEKRELDLNARIIQEDSFVRMEQIIARLNELHMKKGSYEVIIAQLNEAENRVSELHHNLDKINVELFSDDFRKRIQDQLQKFNRHFSNVSFELYGERYAIKFDEKESKKDRRVYKFTSFNTDNFSSGKKQGEITCFDIAYIFFADEEKIPCMHFLLQDKKEQLHGNQIHKLAEFVDLKNIQLIVPILRDKIPVDLAKGKNIILELSQHEKLFRIENSSSDFQLYG